MQTGGKRGSKEIDQNDGQEVDQFPSEFANKALVANERDRNNLAEVLVVEDNFYQSVALITLLQQYGLEIDYATDGQEAFEKVKSRFEETSTSYTLIIMDVFMPICNGFDAVDNIRALLQNSLADPLYICILTA